MRQRPRLPIGTNILGTASSSYAKLSLLLFRFLWKMSCLYTLMIFSFIFHEQLPTDSVNQVSII